MRILHVLDHSLPLHSGYAFRTASILREQRALGWQTLQVTTPKQGACAIASEEAGGFLFHRTVFAANAFSAVPGAIYVQEMQATARTVAALAREFRPDVLHAHSPVLNALPALWVGRRLGIPVVYEVRALWEDAAVDHGTTRTGSPRYVVSRALETFAMRGAAHVTTICEGLRSEIASRGIAADRITVIPNAVDTNEFDFGAAADEGLRARLGLSGSTVLGFAGSFYAYEGLDLLIEAAARLVPRHPGLRLLLVGGGPQEQALRDLAATRGIGDRVVLAGRIPHEDVQRYYALIDVLVYPRRRMRLTDLVTPLKPLEAMAQGRMFVASDVGGHRELIQDGETGFLFEAGDADALARTLERVLAPGGDWPRIRAQARRFVETERTWTRSVARYADVYKAALAPLTAPARLHHPGT
ncbi:MAG: TIGR04063 family PEP-CTERM/XrtA system glycosyltransferase [Casimicrobiaceae bacterium]